MGLRHARPCMAVTVVLTAVQVIAEEFAYISNRSRGFRCALFAASMAGFTLVALLQLIHDGD